MGIELLRIKQQFRNQKWICVTQAVHKSKAINMKVAVYAANDDIQRE